METDNLPLFARREEFHDRFQYPDQIGYDPCLENRYRSAIREELTVIAGLAGIQLRRQLLTRLSAANNSIERVSPYRFARTDSSVGMNSKDSKGDLLRSIERSTSRKRTPPSTQKNRSVFDWRDRELPWRRMSMEYLAITHVVRTISRHKISLFQVTREPENVLTP